MAEDEDHWDSLVGQKEPFSWAWEIKAALREVNQKIQESDEKNMKLAEAMWNVVLKERELAEKEEAERQRLKAEQSQLQSEAGPKEETKASTDGSGTVETSSAGPEGQKLEK